MKLLLIFLPLLRGDKLRHMRNHGHAPNNKKSEHHRTASAAERATSIPDDSLKRAVEAVEEHRNNYDGGGSSVVALRHEGMTEWKAKKKELRMQQKELAKTFGSGYTRKLGSGPAGTTAREFLALEEDIERSGRTVRVPCSPPHCFMRCATDQPCVTHPLVAEWRPPGPRSCPRYDSYQGSNVISRPMHEKWTIYPIVFGIPEQDVVECVPFKTNDFATVVPYVSKSYIFGPADEAEYKRDYRKARFGVTRKKAGWDCMRHYEILAAGAVPLYLDIFSAPKEQPGGILQHLPRRALEYVRKGMTGDAIKVKGCEMKHTEGECSFKVDHSMLDEAEYQSLSCSLLEHTKRHLTTKELARYALTVTGNLFEGQEDFEDLPRVLYIGGTAHNSDYLRDLMFHGFRELLGEKMYEYNTPRYMYEWSTSTSTNQAYANPNKHWGMGFSVARRLLYKPHLHLRNMSGAEDLILQGSGSERRARMTKGNRNDILQPRAKPDPIVAKEARRRALAIIENAANRGDVRAQLKLGIMYAQGSAGKNQSDALAIRWWKSAAENGSADAQRNIENFRLLRTEHQPSQPRRRLSEQSRGVEGGEENRDRARVGERFFDVIIYANAHRGLPLWHTVKAAKYPRSQVIAFNGEDWHGWKQVEEQQEEFGVLDQTSYFLREFPDGCPTGSSIDENFLRKLKEKKLKVEGQTKKRRVM